MFSTFFTSCDEKYTFFIDKISNNPTTGITFVDHSFPTLWVNVCCFPPTPLHYSYVQVEASATFDFVVTCVIEFPVYIIHITTWITNRSVKRYKINNKSRINCSVNGMAYLT